MKSTPHLSRCLLRALIIGAALLFRSTAPAAQKPNVLFIIADQQRYDALGVVNPAVLTPNLDRLCHEGVRFDLAFSAQALCTPDRGSMFSGLYPHAHRVDHNVYGVADVTSDPKYHMEATWPRLLKEAGYHTGYIGKWHLGDKAPAFFDDWEGYNSLMSHWMGKKQESVYRSDHETDLGIQFLERNRDQPFLLCMSYYPPHTPYDPPRKFADLYEGKGLEPPEYWGGVTAVDACVGRILQKLDETGLALRTLVVYVADHGDHFGKRPGSSHKGTGHDESARIPFILRYPGQFEGGAARHDLVSIVDLMPTILNVTGLQQPAGLHGYSLASSGTPGRKAVVIENFEGSDKSKDKAETKEKKKEKRKQKKQASANAGDQAETSKPAKGKDNASRGVRTPQCKLILRSRGLDGGHELYEFYDNERDPGEHTNLYGPAQAQRIAPLLVELERWAKETGDQTGQRLAAACRSDLGLAVP